METDLRKAAEMALKRLDMYFVEHGNDDDFAATQALRQALAQEEKPWVKSYCGNKPNYCTPEQKPVREVWCDCGDGIMPNSGAKCGNCLAAESASREWVGLTDDEIYDYADKFLYQHGSNYGIKSFGKAIEQALKDKNT